MTLPQRPTPFSNIFGTLFLSRSNAFACKFAGSPSVSVCVSLCVCVQSKVSNNVSGRMCLAIEIYLHYYSVLTMRLGSSIPPVPALRPLTVFQSPRTVFDLRSRSLDLWVARQLVKPCLRQHGQACTQRQHLSRWLLSRSLLSLLFTLLPSTVCSAVQSSFGLGSSVTCRNCFQASATKIRFEQPEHLQNVNLQQRINSSVK